MPYRELASGPKDLNSTVTCLLPLIPDKITCMFRLQLNLIFLYCSFSVDNSEYMRNGDFLPTRLQAQQDAVNIVCHSKTRSNPENNVGLITMAK